MATTLVKVVYPGQIDPIGDPATDPATYPLRFLAEGDSWFSFGSWKLHSLLSKLRLTRPAIVVSLAQPGDTITRMSDLAANVELRNWLSRRYGAYEWNALLVSGGGNDLIDDVGAGRIIPAQLAPQDAGKPVEDYVDLAELAKALARIREGYARIASLRDGPDSPCVGVPLVTHAYDWVTPRDAPARFLVPLLGPWLYPALVKARVPEARWNELSDRLLGRLGAALVALEDELPNFHVARTQGTLRRAQPGTTGESLDWANEIHPTGNGFAAIAGKMAAVLERLT